MSDLASLIERLEKLEGPSPEVDEAIQVWSAGATAEWQDYAKRNAYHRDGFWVSIGPVPPYTASLDAVIALAEQKLPGWAYGVDSGPKTHLAFVDRHDYADRIFGAAHVAEAATPAIALLLALLRSLQGADAG